jgi:hypothetical protein
MMRSSIGYKWVREQVRVKVRKPLPTGRQALGESQMVMGDDAGIEARNLK